MLIKDLFSNVIPWTSGNFVEDLIFKLSGITLDEHSIAYILGGLFLIIILVFAFFVFCFDSKSESSQANINHESSINNVNDIAANGNDQSKPKID